MPWKNQNSGGGWQGGGGGRGPWGQGPSGGGPGGGGGGGGPQGPDLEELLRRSQDKFKRVLPGGSSLGPAGLFFLLIVAAAVWLVTGFYRVQTGELGVVTRFGDFQGRVDEPGLKYHWPWPVETAIPVNVKQIRQINIGDQRAGRAGGISQSLMLTGDQSIVDIDFEVQWQVEDPAKYLFNVERPEDTVRNVAESAMREVVGRMPFLSVFTERGSIAAQVKQAMQDLLNEYRTGIRVSTVNLADVDPPAQVIEAYRDVETAKQERQRLQNQAEAYANKVVPEARGDAARRLEEAQGYRDKVTAEADGEAQRFLKIYREYAKAKDVTRQRIYLETLEEVLGGSNKIIIEQDGGSGVVPYLPLPEVEKRRAPAAGGQE